MFVSKLKLTFQKLKMFTKNQTMQDILKHGNNKANLIKLSKCQFEHNFFTSLYTPFILMSKFPGI